MNDSLLYREAVTQRLPSPDVVVSARYLVTHRQAAAHWSFG
jgi:hypothetical protein